MRQFIQKNLFLTASKQTQNKMAQYMYLYSLHTWLEFQVFQTTEQDHFLVI